MVQQSTTAPRGAENGQQGSKTREQQKRAIAGDETTESVAVNPHQKTLAEAREDAEQPAGEFEITHGDRSIQPGDHDESEHRKRRAP